MAALPVPISMESIIITLRIMDDSGFIVEAMRDADGCQR